MPSKILLPLYPNSLSMWAVLLPSGSNAAHCFCVLPMCITRVLYVYYVQILTGFEGFLSFFPNP